MACNLQLQSQTALDMWQRVWESRTWWWFFHGDETEDLEQMILHDVTDDAELVEVPTAALGPERLGEGDQNAGDVVTIPID